MELSGAPHATLPELAEEMLAARAQLLAIAEGRELHWIACGLTPYARMEDVGWVPKSRYEVMREYLPRFGDLAHHMMKGTCSVQANFDFSDEADCARMVKLCSRIAPLTTAMFANSPISEGKETGYQSYRGHIWTRTDPARTGFPRALREDYTHEAWVDYLFDVPMMFFHDGTRYRPAHGKTFREFAERGIDGLFPGPKDWALHQTSVFPEVRIKSTIEVRGADCVSSELALSFCALFTGLMYCNRALDEALVLGEELAAAGPVDALFDAAAHGGMRGEAGGRTYGAWARDLLDIAVRGMARCHEVGLPMLEPLLQRVHDGRSAAEDLLDAWRRDPSPENVLPVIAY